MASSHASLIVIDNGESRASSAASSTSLVNPFATMMAPQSSKQAKPLRDCCFRPTPTYNDNYNPTKPPSEHIKADYSPYDFGEPLFDDREARPSRFPIGHVLALASHYDVKFSKNREYHFNANTLLNAVTHLLEIHNLDEGGDTWRIRNKELTAQPSGIVNSDYDRVIPFRQQEFKNAFLEWIICDNVKHRKAAFGRLKRCFIIANRDVANALPTSHATIENWIHELFTLNIGVAEGKKWKLVLDEGVHWNATYWMIRRGLELRESLTSYAAMLHVSADALDQETFDNDYLSDEEWESLAIIKEQLAPLFYLTKGLEGNAKLTEGALQPSHGALWEALIVLEHIMAHFETLEAEAKSGKFNNHQGI
ncbi:hypothetical protein IFR05_008233 [Cadophora sp. M221]|nr:hypothetical protein IFR05_008233 [Cadophora sp. M221]